jgi:hypothetical protein
VTGNPEDSGHAALDDGGHLTHGVPVSTPTEPEMPWLQPTAELPAQPAGRRRIAVLLVPVLGLLVLCCGGSALVTSVFRGSSDKSSGPTLVVPSSSAAPAPTDSPYPTPTLLPTTKASPSPKPTTRKPPPATVAPPTTKPTPSAPATSGSVQQGVRPGTFCAPRGAIGLTRRGRVLHCGPGPDDPRNRWRA